MTLMTESLMGVVVVVIGAPPRDLRRRVPASGGGGGGRENKANRWASRGWVPVGWGRTDRVDRPPGPTADHWAGANMICPAAPGSLTTGRPPGGPPAWSARETGERDNTRDTHGQRCYRSAEQGNGQPSGQVGACSTRFPRWQGPQLGSGG